MAGRWAALARVLWVALAIASTLVGCPSDDAARDGAIAAEGGRDQSGDGDRDPRVDARPDAPADGSPDLRRDLGAETTAPTCSISVQPQGNMQYRVTVTVRGLSAGRVNLLVEGAITASSPQPITAGAAVFDATALPPTASKKVKLDAEVLQINTVVARCTLQLMLNSTMPPCNLNGPQPPPTPGPQGRPVLNAGQSYTVLISTPANLVELFANSQSQGTQPVHNGSASFAFTPVAGALTLQAICTNTATGASGQSSSAQYAVQ